MEVDPDEGCLSNSNISPDMMFAEPKIDPADYPPVSFTWSSPQQPHTISVPTLAVSPAVA